MPSKENNRAIISVTFVKVYHFQGTSPKCSGCRVVAKMSTKPFVCLSMLVSVNLSVSMLVRNARGCLPACLSAVSQSVCLAGTLTD